MKFYIYTLGCKVNSYESEMMKEKLLNEGYIFCEESPDIVIINTCSVTNTADSKSRKMVRHFRKTFPEAILVVCGCSSENKSSLYEAMDIDILIGNKDKSLIASLIKLYLKDKKKFVKFYHTRKLPFEDMVVDKFTSHTRAFVKIQDGCDNFCSYCIIPFVRGSIRSKDFEIALAEIRNLVLNGHKEIVLTGIHTGSYSHSGHDLTDLIHEMSKIDGLERIRISSIEITELNEKFMLELKTNFKICDHLHIPLQAGSDEILRKMNRKYDLVYFEKTLEKIRQIRPFISITTDIIVGHPFETNDLFFKTLETAEKFKFSKIHAFPYSIRSGTKAACMESQVSEMDKKNRNQALISLSNQLEEDYYKQFLGQEVDVLVEDDNTGFTSNYLKVKILSDQKKQEIVRVKLLSYQDKLFLAEVCK